MKNTIRLKLDMAGRALQFCRSHPDQNPATALVATRLETLVDRAETLSRQQRAGQVTVTGSVNAKNELRDSIQERLQALIGLAQAVAKTAPDLSVHLRMRRGRMSEVAFLTTSRVMVAEARARQDLFLAAAMPPTLLDTLETDLEQYEAIVARQRDGLGSQVGAGAELDDVMGEIMGVVRHLTSIHRLRFRKGSEQWRAWLSARNIAWRLPEQPGAEPPAAGDGRAA